MHIYNDIDLHSYPYLHLYLYPDHAPNTNRYSSPPAPAAAWLPAPPGAKAVHGAMASTPRAGASHGDGGAGLRRPLPPASPSMAGGRPSKEIAGSCKGRGGGSSGAESMAGRSPGAAQHRGRRAWPPRGP